MELDGLLGSRTGGRKDEAQRKEICVDMVKYIFFANSEVRPRLPTQSGHYQKVRDLAGGGGHWSQWHNRQTPPHRPGYQLLRSPTRGPRLRGGVLGKARPGRDASGQHPHFFE